MLLSATQMRLRFPSMDDAQRLAYWLQEAREAKGLTRHQLADRLHIAYTTVYNWERGKKVPNLLMLKPLCEALGVEAEMFRRLDEPPPSPVEQYLVPAAAEGARQGAQRAAKRTSR